MAQNSNAAFNYGLWDPNSTGNTQTFTISFWVRRNNDGEGHRNGILTWDEGIGHVFFGIEFSESSQLRIYSSVSSDISDVFTSDRKFRDYSNWYHIVIQADTVNFTTTSKLKVYVNGSLISGTEGTHTTNTNLVWNNGSYYFSIGAWTTAVNSQLPLYGSLMDVFSIDGAVVDPSVFGKTIGNEWRAQSPSTIKTAIENGPGWGTLGFYLPCTARDGSGEPIVDLSGNYEIESTKNRFLLKNIDTPNSSIPYSLYKGEGVTDRSYAIQTTKPIGSTGVISSGDDFTIEFWMKMSGTQDTNGRILSCRDNDGGGNAYDIYVGSGGRNLYDFGNAINYGVTLPDGQWAHVALCRQNGTGRYYLNGVQQKSQSNTFTYGHADYRLGIMAPPIDCSLGDNYGVEGTYLGAIKIRNGACSYPDGTTFTPPTTFTSDAETILCICPTERHMYEPSDGPVEGTARGDWAYLGNSGRSIVKDNPRRKFARLEMSSKVTCGGVPNSNSHLSQGGYRTELFTDDNKQFNGSVEVTSGKWYYEVVHTHTTVSSQSDGFGWQNNSDRGVSDSGFGMAYVYRDTGGLYLGTTTGAIDRADPGASTWSSWQNYGNDIVAVAIDLDSSPKTIKFYKNGVLQGDAGPNGLGYKMRDGSYQPIIMARTLGGMHVNFGQDSTFGGYVVGSGNHTDANGIGDFYFAPPAGYLALCDENMPVSQNTSQCFGAATWTANGVSGRQITLGFQPDAVLDKRVDLASGAWFMSDSQRGWTNYLYPANSPHTTESTESAHILSTNSTGFTVGSDSNINNGGYTYVAYGFKKSAAFDVVTYTGTGAGQQIPHNLGGTPDLVIVKARNNANSTWSTGGYQMGGLLSPAATKLGFNTSWSVQSDTNELTAVSPTTFTGGGSSAVSGSGNPYVAYLFRSVPGLCKVGNYFMASTDVTNSPCFVHVGFKPAVVIIKRLDSAGDWCAFNTIRNPENPCTLQNRTNTMTEEDTGAEFIDIYSDGFAPRNTATDKNAAGGAFLYIALAGDPSDSDFDEILAR